MLSKVCHYHGPLSKGLSANVDRDFTRTVEYRPIINGKSSYIGLNASSVNRCVSWVPLTETPLVTVMVNKNNSTIFATMPLHTTSMLKIMRPYTIRYDATMVGERRSVLSSGQRAGLGIGVAVAVIAVLAGAVIMLRWCRIKSRKSKTVDHDGETESTNIQERGRGLTGEERAMNASEAPNSSVSEAHGTSRRIHELQVDASNAPVELEGGHQSVQTPAGTDQITDETKSLDVREIILRP
jgi:hypothetical protein